MHTFLVLKVYTMQPSHPSETSTRSNDNASENQMSTPVNQSVSVQKNPKALHNVVVIDSSREAQIPAFTLPVPIGGPQDT